MSVLGAIWETTPSAPMAAVTAVIPSTSGTHAATSAPNAITSTSSVIGSEIISARWRSSETTSSIVESNEPSPACWKSAAACFALVARTVAATPLATSPASSGSPRRRAWTSTIRPPLVESSGASAGPWTELTSSPAFRWRTRSAAAFALVCASSDRMRMLSTAGSRRPAASIRSSAVLDWPAPVSVSLSVLVPAAPPA